MDLTSKKAAFTLVELMVVISIILIATSVLFIGSGGGGGGLKLSSAQRIVSTIAQGARGQALLKNTDTRLIIFSENNADPEKLLRFFGIIYRVIELDTDGNPVTLWKAATQGTYLSEGIYFDKTLSKQESPSELGDIPTMNLEYPRQTPQAEGSGPEFYYYQFNSNGTVSSSPDDFANSWLVLRAGTLKPEGSDFVVDFTEEEKANLKSALIFRRVGTTTMVTDPDFDIN